MVQPLTAAFGQIGKNPMEAASMLGASPWNAWRTTVLPMTRNGYLTAAVLTFAHTVGEFGIVLMVGGNLAGETRVISIAIYESVETLDYEQAHLLSVGLLIFLFRPCSVFTISIASLLKPWAEERKLVLCIDIQARQGDLSLQVNTRIANTVTALAGPSGSGKTTLLRAIAGLTPSEGLLTFNDMTWQDDTVTLPAIGVVSVSFFKTISCFHI